MESGQNHVNGIEKHGLSTTPLNDRTHVTEDILFETNPEPCDFLMYFSLHDKENSETLKGYDHAQVAQTYARCLKQVSYKAPGIIAKLTAGMYSGVSDLSQVKVIDLAAGTGAASQALYEVGFRDLTAHDGAQAMVDHCRQLGIFTDCVCAVLDGSGHLAKYNGTYDIAVAAAAVVPRHIPITALDEMAALVKPGGYIVLCSREYYDSDFGERFDEYVENLENKGVWKKYGRFQFPKYNYIADGHIYIFTKL